MKLPIRKINIFILCLLLTSNLFSQVSSFSATPQTAANCSSCSGDTWTVTPYYYILYSTATAPSKDLNLTNLGFNIPVNAVIKGITLAISSFSCMPEEYYDSDVKLLLNNIPSGSNKATLNNFLAYPSYNNILYGDTNDLWSNTLTPSIVNDINFGVTFKVIHSVPSSFSCFQLNGTFSAIGPVSYYPVITVYYTSAPTNSNTPATGIVSNFQSGKN